MSLHVKVISYKGRPPDEGLEASFNHEGGTLGRSAEKRRNHLSLSDPDRFISRKHATITYENGCYHLTDASKDGTSITNKNIRLCRDTAELNDGDRLRIGDYELIVHIADDDLPFEVENAPKDIGASPEEISLFRKTIISQPEEDLFEEISGADRTPGEAAFPPLQDPFVLPDLADSPDAPDKLPENFDFSELIADADTSESPPGFEHPVKKPIPVGHTIAGHSAFESPSGNSKFDFSCDHRNSQAPPEQGARHSAEESILAGSESPRHSRHQDHLELCEAFMEGAGLKNSTFLRDESTAEFMKKAGTIVREMISGLMVILQGRAELKSVFRITATAITPAGNNPLKSFDLVDEIVDQLLTNSKPGFLDASEAVQDAFTDIKNHQMAMTAGLQAAIIKLIERFDPQHFARQNEGGVVFHRKAKSWDAYEQFYARIVTEALEDFFGESFAQGYEKQIRKLRKKSTSHLKKKILLPDRGGGEI